MEADELKNNTLRQKISNLIVSGELRPGDRLDEQSLAERFGVSRTPIREAILQLSSSGLLEMRPRRSTIVRRFNAAALREAFEALGEIEGLCASYAALRMSEADRLRLEDLLSASEVACREGDRTAAFELDAEFHELLHEGARNHVLQATAESMRLRVTPYSAAPLLDEDFHADLSVPHLEHSAIGKAVLDRDSDNARKLMIKHVSNNFLFIQNLLKRDGEIEQSSSSRAKA
jgi:DNA-binding GntR family transcriptional regulator